MIESGYESFRFFQDPDDFFPSSPNRITNLNGTCIGTTCDFAQPSSESEPVGCSPGDHCQLTTGARSGADRFPGDNIHRRYVCAGSW